MRQEHLASPEALDAFLHGFEQGTLAKSEWTHGAHVAAAGYYLFDSNFETVLPLMRARISTFNLSVGGANTETSGYHETLTHFWLLIVAELIRQREPASRLEAARQAVAVLGEARTLHTLYYSGDVVKDSTARRQWREPDLLPLPGEPAET
ncbi:MAG TPA: hypothetical protein VHZ52_16210 [Acidobacteriaceae bacterium]|jgi:hypothetical protein|nr:hypothetical protein [Acidobacteriaceae bacterium]